MSTKENLVGEYKKLLQICKQYKITHMEKKIQNHLEDLASPLMIMIVGAGKCGKSTLLNALVGECVAEVDDEPKTWCINMYTSTKENPYAVLVYEDDQKNVTLEEAKKILKKIADKDRVLESLTEREMGLKEIRWFLNMEWPGENVFLIDTPGYNQVRHNTSVEKIVVDGVEGVSFSADDGMDQYYYKADLVLWCLEAGSVGDRVVEEKLQEYANRGKRTYGIVTKLDLIESDRERERVFLKNEDAYRKYNMVSCLRSGLPMIYPEDDEDERVFKEQIREESIRGIKKCIDFLVNDNHESDELKTLSSQRLLKEIKQDLIKIITGYLDFYFENYQIYKKITRDFRGDIKSAIECARWSLKNELDLIKSGFCDNHMHRQMWREADENVDAYARLLTTRMDQPGIQRKCEKVFLNYQDSVKDILEHIISEGQWKSVEFRLNDENAVNTFFRSIDDIEWEEKSQSVFGEIQIKDVGLAYEILQLFEKDGLIYQTIHFIAGGMIEEKVISSGMQSVGHLLSEYHNHYRGMLEKYAKQMSERFDDSVAESFRSQTGHTPDRIPQVILEMEQSLFSLGLTLEDSIYYPVESQGCLYFEPSIYRQKLGMIPEWNFPERIVDYVEKQFWSDIFAARKQRIKEKITFALSGYNGSSGLNKVMPEDWYQDLSEDKSICADIPDFNRIEWFGQLDNLKKCYQRMSKEYRTYCERTWNENVRKKEKLVLNLYKVQLFQCMGIEDFLQRWKLQIESDVKWCFNNMLFYSLPRSFSYYEYYKYVYFPMFPNAVHITWMHQYADVRRIPDSLVHDINLFAVDGTLMREQVKALYEELFLKWMAQVREVKINMEKKWDEYMDAYYQQGTEICDQYTQQLEIILEQQVRKKWEEYRRQVPETGGCKSILEFGIKSGKIQRRYVEFLKGNVVELRCWKGFVFSRGDTLGSRWKEYIERECYGKLKLRS